MERKFYLATEIEIKRVTINFDTMHERMDILAELHPMGQKPIGRKHEVAITLPIDWKIIDVIKTNLRNEVGELLEKQKR